MAPQTQELTRLLRASEAKIVSIEARHRQANMLATTADLARERELSQLHAELLAHQETIAGLRDEARKQQVNESLRNRSPVVYTSFFPTHPLKLSP